MINSSATTFKMSYLRYSALFWSNSRTIYMYNLLKSKLYLGVVLCLGLDSCLLVWLGAMDSLCTLPPLTQATTKCLQLRRVVLLWALAVVNSDHILEGTFQAVSKKGTHFYIFIKKGPWFSLPISNEILFIFKYLNNYVCLCGKSKFETSGFSPKKPEQ